MVAGLRDNNDATFEYYPWESYWMDRMGFPNFLTTINFDPGLNDETKEEDILSPEWFDRSARNLLDAVRPKAEVFRSKYNPGGLGLKSSFKGKCAIHLFWRRIRRNNPEKSR